jgi:cytochrome c
MKKLFILMTVAAVSAFTFTSCGGKKEEAKKEEGAASDEYEIAEPAKESSQDLIAQGETLLNSSDCKTCHAIENKLVGPAYKDVATKYEFTRANASMLADKVIAGGAGNWGEVPMTAHPDLSKGDAEKMAMYVLSLDGEQPKD